MLARAGRHAPEGSPLRGELREVAEIAQSALDNVRGLSQSLHPAVLEELGLASAIDAYLPGVERQLGVQVAYEQSGMPADIDPAIGIHVFRVLQEALTNVARHSGVREARVRLAFTADSVELTVEDDGRGIAAGTPARAGAAAPRATTGLASMRERAALAGGTLTIDSPSSGGTRVRLRIPLPGRDGSAADVRATREPETPHAHYRSAR